MNLEETITQLESLGTEQNRKTYKRHGVQGAQFGLSFANMDRLTRSIKRDHNLAQQLWSTGNHDARILATRIADPAQCDGQMLDAWVQDLDNYVITDAFSALAGQTALAQEKLAAWINSEHEWVGTAGWSLVGILAMQENDLPDEFFLPFLDTIQRTIHARKNRVRYSMNNALIAIGTRSHRLEPLAVQAAQAIGKVQVDHGQTNCKTPEARSYIQKTWEHKEKKAAKRV